MGIFPQFDDFQAPAPAMVPGRPLWNIAASPSWPWRPLSVREQALPPSLLSLSVAYLRFRGQVGVLKTRQPIAVSDISFYICLIDIRYQISFRSKSQEQLNERRAGLSKLNCFHLMISTTTQTRTKTKTKRQRWTGLRLAHHLVETSIRTYLSLSLIGLMCIMHASSKSTNKKFTIHLIS